MHYLFFDLQLSQGSVITFDFYGKIMGFCFRQAGFQIWVLSLVQSKFLPSGLPFPRWGPQLTLSVTVEVRLIVVTTEKEKQN